MIKALGSHSKTTLAIISALAGAVLGAAVQYLLTSPFSVWITVAGLLALAVLGLLANQVAIAESRKKADEVISSETKGIAQSVKVSHEAQRDSIKNLADAMKESMHALAGQFGLRVGRLLISETDAFSSVDEDSSAQMIFSVKSELLILDLLAEDGYWPDDAMNQVLLCQAFEKIIAMVASTQSSVSYRRIIQVPDPATDLQNIRNGNLLRHCSDMLRVREAAGNRVLLRVAKQRFPFKFVMIDQEKLILQLQQYNDHGKKLSLWGELQIVDPSRNLISIFRQMWDEIYDADETRNVLLVDLPQR